MHYIIDGYNLLFHHAFEEEKSLEMQRENMIAFLNKLAALHSIEMTVVFDAPKSKGSQGARHHLNALEIVYTEEHLSADDYILHDLAYQKRPSDAVVVTSDKSLAHSAKVLGAKVQNIKSFLSMLLRKKKSKSRSPSQKQVFQESAAEFKRLLEIFERKLELDE